MKERKRERLARTHPRLKQRGERPAHLPPRFLSREGLGPSGRDTPRRVWAESRGERFTWQERHRDWRARARHP